MNRAPRSQRASTAAVSIHWRCPIPDAGNRNPSGMAWALAILSEFVIRISVRAAKSLRGLGVIATVAHSRFDRLALLGPFGNAAAVNEQFCLGHAGVIAQQHR